TNLLDGSFQSKSFQVGANAGQRITIDSIANANTNKLGTSYNLANTAAVAGMTAGTDASFTPEVLADTDAVPPVAYTAQSATAAVLDAVASDALAISITTADGSVETFSSKALAALTGALPTSADTDDLAAGTDAVKLQRLEDVAAETSRLTNGRVTAAVN